ncbi:zinc finger protein 511-like [Penaeus indicus]|uniref:zinc finger protein 511-like n=1 Tax=Penaeus indicus TaxID=29960 RepID=UPI00300C1CC7
MSLNDSWNYLLSLGVQHCNWNDSIFAEGMHVCQPLRKVPCIDLDNEEFLHNKVGVIKCSAPRCNKMFDTVAEHAAHQRACHNYVCSLCKQSFPSHHLLDLHLLEVHDSLFQLMAERRPMYQCLLETCPEKFSNTLERKGHCIRLHKFPADFRYDLNWRKLGKEKKNRNGTKPNQNETSASMECEEVINNMSDDNSNQSVPETMFTEDVTCSEGHTQILQRSKQKVPRQISFGAGVPRGFHRGRHGRGGTPHWHQRGRPQGATKTNIEEVNMKELENSLLLEG